MKSKPEFLPKWGVAIIFFLFGFGVGSSVVYANRAKFRNQRLAAAAIVEHAAPAAPPPRQVPSEPLPPPPERKRLFEESTIPELKRLGELAEKRQLWISDFKAYEHQLKLDEAYLGEYVVIEPLESHGEFLDAKFFIDAFGTPDKESLLGTVSIILANIDGRSAHREVAARTLTFENRLTNPTTMKKEDLRIVFLFGKYYFAEASPSFNKTR